MVKDKNAASTADLIRVVPDIAGDPSGLILTDVNLNATPFYNNIREGVSLITARDFTFRGFDYEETKDLSFYKSKFELELSSFGILDTTDLLGVTIYRHADINLLYFSDPDTLCAFLQSRLASRLITKCISRDGLEVVAYRSREAWVSSPNYPTTLDFNLYDPLGQVSLEVVSSPSDSAASVYLLRDITELKLNPSTGAYPLLDLHLHKAEITLNVSGEYVFKSGKTINIAGTSFGIYSSYYRVSAI
jgi:hypothetical protein